MSGSVRRPRPALALERGLRRGEARDGDAEGRARDVIEADLAEEVDARRIAAVLAADAELDARPRRAPPLLGHLHQRAHARDVDRLERILGEDVRLDVRTEELAGVVARDA